MKVIAHGKPQTIKKAAALLRRMGIKNATIEVEDGDELFSIPVVSGSVDSTGTDDQSGSNGSNETGNDGGIAPSSDEKKKGKNKKQ